MREWARGRSASAWSAVLGETIFQGAFLMNNVTNVLDLYVCQREYGARLLGHEKNDRHRVLNRIERTSRPCGLLLKLRGEAFSRTREEAKPQHNDVPSLSP